MRYRQLGTSGLTVSVVGLGCNNFGGRLDVDATRRVVDAALEEGITLFDTADIYGGRGASETQLGEVLKGRRDEVVLATKFGHESGDMGYDPELGAKGSRSYIRYAAEQSLRRLGTDHIDLYQQHSPDSSTPIEETLAALDELVQEGKVRAIGSSNFSAEQLSDADAAAKARGLTAFGSAQNHWSLLERDVEADVVPTAVRLGVGVLPYFPLANGLLTGKVRRDHPAAQGTRLYGSDDYVTDDKLDRVEALAALADKLGRSMLDLAVAGLGAQPGCASVIAGATTPEQVRANAATADFEPDADLLAALDEIFPSPVRR